jgi:hypothetical protein
MARYRHVTSGSVVSLSDETAKLMGADLEPLDDDSNSSDGYSSMKVDELKAEIESRNEGRDDADLLSTDGKKADLIATLEADDNN